jgi:general secretion pathway protein G
MDNLKKSVRRARRRSAVRNASRFRLEGMTLVEIMIVVIIMALIATAVGVGVLPQLKKARIKQARTDCSTVQSAAVMWIAENPGRCPTMEQLKSDGQINRSTNTKDPWDHDYIIECESDDVVVSSAGPDGQTGSEDDIR